MSHNYTKEVKKDSIFIIWVFKYKFDNKKYLIKYKIRLCARSDL